MSKEENDFIVEGAKRELAFYEWLVKDWVSQGYDYLKIKSFLARRGLEKTNEEHFNIGEYQQVDFLGFFMGFTLVDKGKDTQIAYAWAFDEREDYGRTEIKKGE